MIDSKAKEARINKQFIKTNSKILKQYAINNQEKFGAGIIVINLTLVQNQLLTEKDLIIHNFEDDNQPQNDENTLIHPISYIIYGSFWFKILRIKIKKKYQIDIKNDYDLAQQFLLVFVKDSSLESFSIYSMKTDKSNKSL